MSEIPGAERAASTDGQVSKREVLGVLFLRRRTIVSVFAGVVAVAIFLLYWFLSPTYEASSTIIIETSDLVLPLVDAPPVSDFDKLTSFQTQKDILGSATIATRVVDRLHLDSTRVIGRPERVRLLIAGVRRTVGGVLGIRSWRKPHNPRDAAIDAVLKHLTTTSRSESKAIKLTYRAMSATEAAQTLNTLVEEYRKYFFELIQKRATGVTTYLGAQATKIHRDLAESESALLAFKQNDRLERDSLALPPRADGFAGEPGPDRPAHARPPAGIEAQNGNGPGLTGITDSPMTQNEIKVYVLSMEDEVRKLSAQYAPQDPVIVGLRNKIDRYVGVLDEIPRRELELLRLRRALDLNQDVYLFLRKNLERARVVEGGNSSAINLITVMVPASPDDNPVAPRKRMATAIAVLFGLGLGILSGFVQHYLDHTLRSPQDVERYLGLRTLASLSRL